MSDALPIDAEHLKRASCLLADRIVAEHDGIAPDADTLAALRADDRQRDRLHGYVVDELAPLSEEDALAWLAEDFAGRGAWLTRAVVDESDPRRVSDERSVRWASAVVIRGPQLFWYDACEAAWDLVEQRLRGQHARDLAARARDAGVTMAGLALAEA